MLYSRSFPVRIITPTGITFEGTAYGVQAPGSLSPFEVLAKHVPLVSSLDVGEIRLALSPSSFLRMAVSGGVLEVTRSGVNILADSAELASEIDVERARQARDRATQRLRTRTPDLDEARAEAALARALNRIRVAKHAHES